MSVNDSVLRLLQSKAHWMLGGAFTALRVRGVVSGDIHEFPVNYRRVDRATLEVLPGAPERKKWWRNLRQAAPVQVLLNRTWREATAVVEYRRSVPVVVITLDGSP